jgi:hypothetical protein
MGRKGITKALLPGGMNSDFTREVQEIYKTTKGVHTLCDVLGPSNQGEQTD